jgi:hypothetical protein
MYSRLLRYLFIAGWILYPAPLLFSQVYPVTSQVSVPAPVPYSLEGFCNGEASQISLCVLINDQTLSDYPVKLRVRLRSSGIEIRTGDWFNPEPLFLTAGEPLFLDGSFLAPWFDPQNLEFSGISREQYRRNRQLPEGMYQLSIGLFDFYRDIQVSSSPPALLFISLSEPPLLALPEQGAGIMPETNPVVAFSWTSRHTSFVYPGFMPEYELELWEIWPEGRSPEDLVFSQPPHYTTSSNATTLNLNLQELNLVPGRSYLWRVRINDPASRAAFRNGGCSQLRWFRYGKTCPGIEPSIASVSSSSASLSWPREENHESFELRYRPAQQKNAPWYFSNTSEGNQRISPLKSDTEYEFQLRAFCNAEPTDWSQSLSLRTRSRQEPVCGGTLDELQIKNTRPLTALLRGDLIQAAGFLVEILEVTGSNGEFSGRGCLQVPWLNSVKLEVIFDHIGVNDEYCLFRGFIRSVYTLSNSLLLNTGILSDMFDNGQELLDNPYLELADQTVHTDSSIREVILTEDGNIILVTTGGEQIKVDENTRRMIAVETPSGEQFLIDRENHTLYSGTAKPPSSPVREGVLGEPVRYLVNFSPDKDSKNGFDLPADEGPADNYNEAVLGGKTKKLAWISLESGGSARLQADITGEPPDSVKFFRSSGNLVMAAQTGNPGMKNLLLTGLGAGEEEALQAFFTGRKPGATDSILKEENMLAGQVQLVSYERLSFRVCLVPVNGSDCPDAGQVQDYLNRVYAPAMVDFFVSVEDSFYISLKSQTGKVLDNTDPDDRMNYTGEMKTVISAYRESFSGNDGDCYLFFFDGSTDRTAEGYMPFKKRYGFIYKNDQSPERWLRTLAHELGHGAFRLRHTYSGENEYQQAEGSTDNLMDNLTPLKAASGEIYPPSPKASAGETHLYKYQWDQIQNPEARVNWWEEEEEGEMSILKLHELIRSANQRGSDELSINLSKDYLFSQKNIMLNNKQYNYLKTEVSIDNETLSSYENDLHPSMRNYEYQNLFAIDPGDSSNISYDSIKGSFSINFYELKKNKFGLNEKSDNILISFEIPISRKNDFIEYLYPSPYYQVNNLVWYSQTDDRFKDEDCYCKKKKDGSCRNVCCERTCREILYNAGFSASRNDVIDIAKLADANEYSEVIPISTFNVGLEYLDSIITKCHYPVIVGVHHESSSRSGNYNSGTYHFIVIVGKGFDKSQNKFYYNFYEVGTKYQTKGISESNRLFIDPSQQIVSGPAPICEWYYTITEIRRTKKK